MSYHFLLDLALILLSTKILGLIAQKFQMPQVVGALIAGLLLSPAGLGLLSETEFTKQLSELGVIGLHLQLVVFASPHLGVRKRKTDGGGVI